MCGICGVFEYKAKGRVDDMLVKAMCDTMIHRGPDGEGQYVKNNIGLGHRRLSIIDLSEKGAQPMSNEDGTLWITYNGEVYNFRKLRGELESKGRKFKSNTDTEVVLHLYEQEGEDFLKNLRGMFAIAIWDSNKKKLILARDRAGQKPLFYADLDGTLIFASEINAILLHPKFKKEVDVESLHYYLTHCYLYAPYPHTLFKGIRKLPPAHYLTLDEDGMKIKRYWQLDYSKKTKKTEKECISEYKRLLEESVTMRQISDVPLGVLLSGGLDSSTIVSLMAREPGKRMKSFSIGSSTEDTEFKRARLVSKKYDTQNFEVIFQPKDLKLLTEIIYHLGEPFNMLTSLYSLDLTKLISKEDVTVVLAGNGADELFGGYDYHNQLAFLDLLFRLTDSLPKFPFKFLRNIFPSSDSRFASLLDLIIAPAEKRKTLVYHKVSRELKGVLYSKDLREKVAGFDVGGPLDRVFNEHPNASFFDRMLYTELFMGNMHSTVVTSDVTGMISSIEIRAPFLDHKLMEFAASLPRKMKVRSIFDKSGNKYVMKKAMVGELPGEILSGKKMGFGYNIAWGEWLRSDWKPLLEDVLLNRSLPDSGLFNVEGVKKIIDEHASKVRDHSLLLWGLVAFEVWYEIYFTGMKPEDIVLVSEDG